MELFTGTGGLALGLAAAGFQHELLADWDEHACATLEVNKHRVPEMAKWSITHGDVRQIDFTPHAGQVDLLAAGAPCQPFSLGGKHVGEADDRNMFPEVIRAVREIRPRAVIVENVRGLVRPSFLPYFNYILRQLTLPERQPEPGETWRKHDSRLKDLIETGVFSQTELQYDVHKQFLDSADFGVPQRRHRVFIAAFRADLGTYWLPLRATHSQDALLYSKYVDGSYWREHELHAPEPSDRARSRIAQLAQGPRPAEWRWRTVRDALRGLPEPIDYQDDLVFPDHAGNPGARTYTGHTGSPLDEPAKTLKAGVHGVPGGENTLRREDGTVRYFSVREAARLQTFPDAYKFSGPWSECMRQLGNAVPVRLAELVARRVRNELERPGEEASQFRLLEDRATA